MAVREWGRASLARAREDLPNFLSLMAFFGGTALIFRSLEFALVVTASLGFHELGHVAALRAYRLQWRISFSAAGAMTWSSLRERARLSQMENTAVHLAGPVFSLLLALIALGLHATLLPDGRHLLILANFSAQVGFLNLLPLGAITDGGKVFQRMVLSLRERHRQWAVVLPFAITALMLGLYTLLEQTRRPPTGIPPFLLSLLLVGVWMAAGLLLEARRAALPDRDKASGRDGSSRRADFPRRAARPLTFRQVVLLLLLVWDILVFYLIVISITPFWLEPAYLLGALQNLTGMAQWIARLLQ